MVEYKIVKCDSVVDCSGNYRPMLYFEPSMDIIINMRNNEDILFIDIIDTDQYSGSSIPVVIDIATCNFTYGQQFYTATLVDTQWVGIPKHLGHFIIHKGPLNKCGSVPDTNLSNSSQDVLSNSSQDVLSDDSQDVSPDDSPDDSQDVSPDVSPDDSQDVSPDDSQDTDTSQKCISKSKSIQNGLIVLVVILVVFLIILSVMRM